jgi:hypothetical protein
MFKTATHFLFKPKLVSVCHSSRVGTGVRKKMEALESKPGTCLHQLSSTDALTENQEAKDIRRHPTSTPNVTRVGSSTERGSFTVCYWF